MSDLLISNNHVLCRRCPLVKLKRGTSPIITKIDNQIPADFARTYMEKLEKNAA